MSTRSTLDASSRDGDAAAALAPEAHLFVVLRCDAPRALPSRHALAGLRRVRIGRGSKDAARRDDGELDLRIDDGSISSDHAVLEADAWGRWTARDLGSRNGVVIGGARRGEVRLADGDVIEVGRTFLIFRDAVPTAPADPPSETWTPDPDEPALTTLLLPLARRFEALRKVAAAAVPVLVTGETGSGKERVARAVHAASRRPGTFVGINAAALPATLVESELFGADKGAFTGAVERRAGLIRAADRGTLFLDEIGELAPASQASLLRVLQEREVTPLGASKPVKVDLRVVAATHRDLDAAVASGAFRADLRARLAGFTLALPPLRERREDLGGVIASLLGALAPDRAVRLSRDAAAALLAHAWPANVRQLEHALSVALALALPLSGDGRIGREHLPESLFAPAAAASVEAPVEADEVEESLSPDDVARKAELERLLAEHGGNVAAVARAMGKAPTQIHRWLTRYRLRERR